jgi:hypothetical protein
VPSAAESTLREVIEALAPIERPPCSAGERQAAEWIVRRLAAAGFEAEVEEEDEACGSYLDTLAALGLAAAGAALLALRGHRTGARRVSVLAAALLVDEAQNGPRLLRRLVRRRLGTANVVAAAGDPYGERTLVVLAHHDARQTGVLRDDGLRKLLHRLPPERIESSRTMFPRWWIALAGPALTIAGRPRAGLVLSLLLSAFAADSARGSVTPGANGNLSGVAGLVALAESAGRLRGVRLMLVSCGADEALQEGVRAFLRRHRHELGADRTWFVNLETVGSPRLIMLEGEGPIWIEDYARPGFRDAVAAIAERDGIALDRGYRARASTAGVIPSRAGYPTVTLTSTTTLGTLANHRRRTDVPADVDYRTVADAVRLSLSVARSLAD